MKYLLLFFGLVFIMLGCNLSHKVLHSYTFRTIFLSTKGDTIIKDDRSYLSGNNYLIEIETKDSIVKNSRSVTEIRTGKTTYSESPPVIYKDTLMLHYIDLVRKKVYHFNEFTTHARIDSVCGMNDCKKISNFTIKFDKSNNPFAIKAYMATLKDTTIQTVTYKYLPDTLDPTKNQKMLMGFLLIDYPYIPTVFNFNNINARNNIYLSAGYILEMPNKAYDQSACLYFMRDIKISTNKVEHEVSNYLEKKVQEYEAKK